VIDPAQPPDASFWGRVGVGRLESVKYRKFAATERLVSEVGLGTWQLGASDWGRLSDAQASEILQAAVDAGVTFFDTADIYGGGTSERRIGAFLRELAQSDAVRARQIFVATKLGRSGTPGGNANLTYEAMRAHTEGSLLNLGCSRLDLTQTHCLSHEAMKEGKIFENLRKLKREGLIAAFGASVETVEEGLDCLNVEELSSLQVIFNVFRQKPAEQLFLRAAERNVAIIVRLPLASGLLGGKMSTATEFDANDHRSYNRDGQAFNVGETFAGVGFERGLELTDRVKRLCPQGLTMGQFATRFCLDFPAVTTVIPGASKAAQVVDTTQASDADPLTAETHAALQRFYAETAHAAVRGRY
jgi:aryl-alcohol dehydrogenase-like predicted oxidoreductase